MEEITNEIHSEINNCIILSNKRYSDVLELIKHDRLYKSIIKEYSEERAIEVFITNIFIELFTHFQPMDIIFSAMAPMKPRIKSGFIKGYKVQFNKEAANKLRSKFIGYDVDLYIKRKLFECVGILKLIG